MSENNENKPFGIASLYDKEQLRSSFVNFLYIVVGLELIIFIVMLVTSKLAEAPFPWKTYLFITFTVPVAITFLIGIFILAFNYFFFGQRQEVNPQTSPNHPPGDSKSYLFKTNSFIDSMRKVPFMVTLFLIIIGALAAYNLDDALLVIINTSEQLVKYLFIAMGILLLMATLVALTWLTFNYKLRKKHMDNQNKYRQAAMEQLGMLIIEDQETIDHRNIITAPLSHQSRIKHDKRKGLIILPPAGEKKEGTGQ